MIFIFAKRNLFRGYVFKISMYRMPKIIVYAQSIVFHSICGTLRQFCAFFSGETVHMPSPFFEFVWSRIWSTYRSCLWSEPIYKNKKNFQSILFTWKQGGSKSTKFCTPVCTMISSNITAKFPKCSGIEWLPKRYKYRSILTCGVSFFRVRVVPHLEHV